MRSDRNLFADLSVGSDIARAWTLPADLYTDPSVLTHEHQHLFGRTWQVAGRREQVARPGDYFTCQIADEPLLVVRDGEGKLRAFYNVCRHRAGPPAEGCGSRKVFRCSYHGWTYGLDGRLITAPEFEGVQDFREEEFGLRPVPVEEWAAWVFVNLDDSAEPLLTALGELTRQAERFPLERMRFFERREYVMQCNWKTYVDNYLEGYHLPSVHPGLNRELDYGQYVTETFARHSRQSSPIRGPESERDAPRRYPDAAGLAAEYFWIFPNWMLNCYPDNVSLNIVMPLAAEQTLAIFEWYVLAELMMSDAAQAGVRFSHETQLEDGDICEKVQRNLRSRSYQRGRFSVHQEKGVHHFHRLYAEWIKRD
ncbi:MAG TPA: aromatic ring-hydroxylating dioxygenase subunit alpha [Terriglobales bacterium]|nr:aromatic ring-hydroxylating dioxygenase subunit alpha [Terriglobales bacterium]